MPVEEKVDETKDVTMKPVPKRPGIQPTPTAPVTGPTLKPKEEAPQRTIDQLAAKNIPPTNLAKAAALRPQTATNAVSRQPLIQA